MKILLKNNEIKELITFIKKEYKEKIDFYYFHIISVDFNFDEVNPSLKIGIKHHLDKNSMIELQFDSVYAHKIMSESNIFYYEDEEYEINSFISILKKSRFSEYVMKNSLLQTQLEIQEESKKIYNFRVFAGNFFIDVLTSEFPTFKIVDKPF